jgi:UDP-glucose 4-epimerase|tara:strand:+ start:2976 stop:3839 length:864 start_codon:yes stop_codon:yes gene_type:complete
MNILVTGGAGFVGTNLIIRLVKDGHKVVSIDNYSTGFKENEQEGCTYWDYDLSTGINPVLDRDEYDVIFHLAALARIQPSIKNPYKTLYNNFLSSLNVLETARKNNCQVIYAGSSTRHHGIFKSPYAWSKLSGEHLCNLYSNVYDLNTCICRFYNVYGKYHIRSGDYATVLGIFEKQYMENKPITITSNGEQRRDFTHIDDIVDALVACMGKDFRAEELELGRGVNYSINEIANWFGEDYPKEYLAERPGEYDATLCNFIKAEVLLNWKPTKNIKDYVVTWLKEYHE